MDIKDIKSLIDLMRKNELSVFKMEQEGFKITLKRGQEPVITTVAAAPVVQALPAALPAAAPAPQGQPAAPAAPAEKFKEITSPMVGTFYASPSPEAASYVSVGQAVTPDTVVCIVEAMKVMNEIKAEISGTIVEICAENGKPVQFGQALFKVK